MKKILLLGLLVIVLAGGGIYLYQTYWRSTPPPVLLLMGGVLEGEGTVPGLPHQIRSLFQGDDIPMRVVNVRRRDLNLVEHRRRMEENRWLEKYSPGMVVFMPGRNEAWAEGEKTRVLSLVRELRQISRRIQAHRNSHGSKPLFFLSNLPLPPKEGSNRGDTLYRRWIQKMILPAVNRVGREESVRIVNLYGFSRRYPGYMKGKSPGPEGVSRMAAFIYRNILPYVKGISGPGREKLPGPFEGKIVFQSDRRQNEDIYLLNREGVRPLTTHPAEDSYPVLSPRGDRLVFESRRSGKSEIYWMELKEGKVKKLFDSPAEDHYPFWTYDGKFIYFNRMVKGKEQVFRFEWNGGEIRQITDWKGRNIFPAVNPAHTRLLVTTSRLIGWQIHSINLETGRVSKFSREYGGCRSRFSHDGESIAWVSHKADHKGDVYLTPAETLNPLRLTTNSEKHDYYPAFSPDDRHIVYASGPHLKTGNYDLMIIEIATSRKWRITTAPSKDILPYWSR